MEHPTAAETAANAATDIAPPTGWAAVKQKIVACFWEVEEHLADIFGLNDSKYQFAIDDYAFAALNLYLDIINLFLHLLRIFGERR